MSGELSLVIAPLDKSNNNSQMAPSARVRHFRALFDYDPEVRHLYLFIFQNLIRKNISA